MHFLKRDKDVNSPPSVVHDKGVEQNVHPGPTMSFLSRASGLTGGRALIGFDRIKSAARESNDFMMRSSNQKTVAFPTLLTRVSGSAWKA